MARLGARYRHFWARGLTYRHIWQSAGDGSATGATITATASVIKGATQTDNFVDGQTVSRNVSLIAGAAHGDGNASGVGLLEGFFLFPGTASGNANIAGDTITVDIDLVAGRSSIDGLAPLNTRVNATYRHFWARKKTYRHLWQSWEGPGITPAGGNAILIALTIVELGTATGEANAEGQVLEVGALIGSGQGQGGAVVPGVGRIVTTSILDGVATGEANVNGATITVQTQILNGVFVPGQNVVAQIELIPGAVATNALVPGDTVWVDAFLLEGITVVIVPGQFLVVETSVEAGVATGQGVTLLVQSTIIAGEATAVNLGNQTFFISAVLLPGQASAPIPSQTLVVGVTLIPGTASVIVPAPPISRHGGPIGYHTKPKVHELNAQVFGTVFALGATVLEGKARGEHAFAPLAPTPDVVLEIVPPSESSRATVAELLRIGNASAHVLVQGATLEHRDWTKYDNLLLELI